MPRLPNAGKDASDLCDAIKRMGFKASCYYDLRSRRAFREAVQNFVLSLNRTDAVFIYYAGHGVQHDNENYLLPTNVDPISAADIEEDGLTLTYLLRSLEGARTGPNIVILDACREAFRSGQVRGSGRGLAATEPPTDTILVYATAPNEYAYDSAGKNSHNGLFATHLLAHIEEPGLTVDQLFGIVAEAVQQEARANKVNQLPYRNSALSASFCLAGCDTTTATEQAKQIGELNAQLQELSAKYSQREAELAQLAELRVKYAAREAEILALQSKNSQRDADIAKLMSRIQTLQGESASAGATRNEGETELLRLRSELSAIQQERQRDAALLEQRNIGHDKELAELRAREAQSQKMAQEVEGYRQKVEDLQKEKAELQRRAATEPGSPNPHRVVVPTF